jgi:hypothetical protein
MPMYLRCSSLIQKQVSKNILFFAVDITFSVLMFQIFADFSRLKIKSFEPLYLSKQLSYTNMLEDDKTCFF